MPPHSKHIVRQIPYDIAVPAKRSESLRFFSDLDQRLNRSRAQAVCSVPGWPWARATAMNAGQRTRVLTRVTATGCVALHGARFIVDHWPFTVGTGINAGSPNYFASEKKLMMNKRAISSHLTENRTASRMKTSTILLRSERNSSSYFVHRKSIDPFASRLQPRCLARLQP